MNVVKLDGSVDIQSGAEVIAKLEAISKDNGNDIWLIISSYGGSVSAMFGIAECMHRIPNDVITVVIGKAMSAGFFISISGTPGKRYVCENVQIMAHNPIGAIDPHNDSIGRLEWIADEQLSVINETTNISVDEMRDLMRHDVYMTAEEAVEKGFYDGIMK